MKHTLLLVLLVAFVTTSCGGNRNKAPRQAPAGDDEAIDTTLLQLEAEKPLERFPDTVYSSVEALKWIVEVKDSTDSGMLKYLDDPYEALCADEAEATDSTGRRVLTTGTFTFRGNHRRDMPVTGRVSGTPHEIVKVWEFATASDTTHTPYGVWYGGAGWTGQPVFVHWSDSAAASFRALSPALTRDFGEREIIAGSLCGNVYFINFDTGRASRQPIYSGNIIKGAVSLDPQLPNLYVGHGVPLHEPFGHITIDLEKHAITDSVGRDPGAWRGWRAYDGCAIVAGDYLFRTGENGTFYKYVRGKGSLRNVALLRFREKGAGGSAGIESSLAVCRNYGYFCDNRGNILCVNLDTMAPVWHYNNHDDSDATIVVEEVDDTPYIYTCSELDKQGSEADVHFVKLNGLTGEPVWDLPLPCRIANGGKRFEGGMFATPLLGRGDCEDLIFTNICDHQPPLTGYTVAIDRACGNIVWQTRLGHYAWSSPLAFCSDSGKMYLFVGDCTGHAYLMDARSGEILFKSHIANNFEASGVVAGDCVVIPSRGNMIYKLKVQ